MIRWGDVPGRNSGSPPAEGQGSNQAAGPGRLVRPGAFSYIQLPAVGAEKSADFYEAVFGWTIRQRGTSHVGFDDASGDVSGAWVTDRAIAREAGILPYIYVDGIDAAVRSIETHGGELVTAPYPEGNLWVATFRDPAGNLLGLWQMGPRSGSPAA